eukprot:m.58255 g.58255  ORF g.58255 m.58255 type:complete len:512 (+) comp11167_c0_seq1:66-1601(+)
MEQHLQLPTELWEQIWGAYSLSIADLVRFSEVSRKCREIAHNVAYFAKVARSAISDRTTCREDWSHYFVRIIEDTKDHKYLWDNICYLLICSGEKPPPTWLPQRRHHVFVELRLERNYAYYLSVCYRKENEVPSPPLPLDVMEKYNFNGANIVSLVVHDMAIQQATAGGIDTGQHVSLPSLHSVYLRDCWLGKAEYVLKAASFVDCWHCNDLQDVSFLSNAYSVTLRSCELLRDVSPLSNIHYLCLANLNITDVSLLGNIHTVVLEECNSVVNVDALATVNTLTIIRCQGIVDIATLGTVHTLKLTFCVNLKVASLLPPIMIMEMYLEDFTLEDEALQLLSGINTITFRDCVIGSVQPLQYNVQSLSLGNSFSELEDIYALPGGGTLQCLEIKAHPTLQEVSPFRNLHTLSLLYCRRLENVNVLGGGLLHTLTICQCRRVSKVGSLGSIHTLTLRSLGGVNDVSGLATVNTLTLIDLDYVTDISMLKKVPHLDVRDCKRITDYSALPFCRT